MEWRKILLACAVLHSVASTKLADLLPTRAPITACDDSARSTDSVTESTLETGYMGRKAWEAHSKEEKYYLLSWSFHTPSDIDIKKEGNRVEMKCESGGEIKGTGDVMLIRKGGKTQFSDDIGGSKELDRDTTYSLYFEGEFDKTPIKGDNCETKMYVTLNDEEKSYCMASKIEVE